METTNCITIHTLLPRSDDELRGAYEVHFARENCMLQEVIRLIKHCHAMRSLRVSSLSMLLGNDKAGDFPPVDAGRLRSLHLSGQFQKGCVRQMRWIADMLLGAHGLESLTLCLAEYPTDHFLTTLKIEHCQPYIAPMPGMPSLNSDRLCLEEAQSAQFAMMFLNRLFRKQLCDRPGVTKMEEEIARVLNEKNETGMLTLKSAGGALVTQDPNALLKYMTQEDYTATLGPLFGARMPEGLREFHFTGTLQGSMPSPFTLFFLPQLVRLNLSFCQMDDAAFEVVGCTIGRRLPSLRALDMCRNRLQDSDLAALVGGSLEQLTLQHNPISSRAASLLFRGMENNATLTAVDLSHTSITRHGLSLSGLSKWLARPARLVLPCCFETEELFEVMRHLPTGAELEMVGTEAKADLVLFNEEF